MSLNSWTSVLCDWKLHLRLHMCHVEHTDGRVTQSFEGDCVSFSFFSSENKLQFDIWDIAMGKWKAFTLNWIEYEKLRNYIFKREKQRLLLSACNWLPLICVAFPTQHQPVKCAAIYYMDKRVSIIIVLNMRNGLERKM